MDISELMVFLIGFVFALVLVVYLVQVFSAYKPPLPRTRTSATPPSPSEVVRR